MSIDEAVEWLKKEAFMSVMAASSNGKWFGLYSEHSNVGCVLSEAEDGNVTFVLNIMLSYGKIEYAKMHTGLLKTAGVLGIRRLKAIDQAMDFTRCEK